MTVLFVCTGNTCRSPMAEGFARKMATERGLQGITFASAGTGAIDGIPASDGAILVGIERGVDLSPHRSRALADALAEALAKGPTLVLALSVSHLTAAQDLNTDAQVYLLDEYATHGKHHRSVRDPFGGGLDEYRKAADDIEAMLAGVLDRLASEQAREPRS